MTADTPLWFLDFCAGSGLIRCHAVRLDPSERRTTLGPPGGWPTYQRPLCGARCAGSVQDPLGNGVCLNCLALCRRAGHRFGETAAWPGGPWPEQRPVRDLVASRPTRRA